MYEFSHLFKASMIVGIVMVALVLGWCTNDIGAHATDGESSVSHDEVPVSRYVAIAKGQVDLEDGIIRLAASRDGLIRQVFVNEGDFVKRGQVLLVIDDKQARLLLKQALVELEERRAALGPFRARLAVAQREVARLAPLAQS
jgi:multidrug efflux pump subunit AcrA (membrane-fusion protein)